MGFERARCGLARCPESIASALPLSGGMFGVRRCAGIFPLMLDFVHYGIPSPFWHSIMSEERSPRSSCPLSSSSYLKIGPAYGRARLFGMKRKRAVPVCVARRLGQRLPCMLTSCTWILIRRHKGGRGLGFANSVCTSESRAAYRCQGD